MAISRFIATERHGITRASRDRHGNWVVGHLLQGQDVHCLATDPLQEEAVYAGTRYSGVLRSSDAG